MDKKVIRGDLSEKGIQSIIDQLKDYKQDLYRKTELFCKKLVESGMEVAESHIAESPLDLPHRSKACRHHIRYAC